MAGELVLSLRDDLDDEFLGDDFPAGSQPFVEGVGFVQFGDDAAGIRGAGRLKRLQGVVLRFLDIGTDFVVIGSHVWRFSFLLFGFFPDQRATYTMTVLFPRKGSAPGGPVPVRLRIKPGCGAS
jgi:hypothetical protein